MTKTPATDPLNVYSIGLKPHSLRAAKHLTLARLSSETGLSTALLSKLETNRMVPTLHTLDKICRVYGIGLGHFFCEPQQHSVAITRNAHFVDRREHPSPKLTPLHVPTADGKQVSKILDLPAGVASAVAECGSKTEFTAYVLCGSLHLSIAGSSELLGQGDCVVVNTDQAVLWSAAADARCRILTVSAK